MDKKVYEISFVLSGRLIDAELKELLEKIKQGLEGLGAKILKQSEFNKINLAYPIKKEVQTYFGYFWFELEPEKISEIKNIFLFEKNILRYLIVTPPPKYQQKTVKPKAQPRVLSKEQIGALEEFFPIATESIEDSADQESKELTEAEEEKLEEKLEEIQKLA